MVVARAFGTSVATAAPTDGSAPQGDKIVSEFITVGSLTNFTAMTGALSAAWGALMHLSHHFDGNTTPFVMCMIFALVSFAASTPGKAVGKFAPALLIALLNGLTLFSATLGASALAPGN